MTTAVSVCEFLKNQIAQEWPDRMRDAQVLGIHSGFGFADPDASGGILVVYALPSENGSPELLNFAAGIAHSVPDRTRALLWCNANQARFGKLHAIFPGEGPHAGTANVLWEFTMSYTLLGDAPTDVSQMEALRSFVMTRSIADHALGLGSGLVEEVGGVPHSDDSDGWGFLIYGALG